MRAEITSGLIEGVHFLSLDRPEAGNRLSAGFVEELHRRLDAIQSLSPKVVVLAGDGRHFCTGFDLSEVENQSDADLLYRFTRIEQLIARIWAAPFATIGVAKGRTLGAGADLFVACSHRIAVDDATFSFPGAAFGLVLGTRRLAARIGADAAIELIKQGATINARVAADLGLADVCASALTVSDCLDSAITKSTRLDVGTLRAVQDAARSESSELDVDLANLVRSAAAPGLASRISAYKAGLKAS